MSVSDLQFTRKIKHEGSGRKKERDKNEIMFLFADAVSLLVIMGCSCCKQKKASKSKEATPAIDVADLSPSNRDDRSTETSNQGRYCADPTQSIPDYNKTFLTGTGFPSISSGHQHGGVCVCVEDCKKQICGF